MAEALTSRWVAVGLTVSPWASPRCSTPSASTRPIKPMPHCRCSNSLNPKTLAWWRSRLRKLDRETAAAEFVPTFTAVTVAPDLTAGTIVLALDDHRAHVVVDRDTDLELLRRLLEVVA